MRINARLDDDHSRKLEQLKASRNMSVSDILKQAIDLLYAQESQAPQKKLAALLDSEFVGIGEASETFASDYKKTVQDEVAAKHGTR